MKSCLFVLIGMSVLAALAITLGTIFFISADTKVKESTPAEETSLE
ncbi:hypothetical protein ACFPK9_04795 [Rubritalea spongiae]|uniref:Uncharacterized protein n=1 Tax=Rubritalea spongiae TaxID=430797 RepID=A0ABW5E5H7_9BACT